MVSHPASHIRGKEKLLLFEVVFGLLHFKWVVDHFNLHIKCLFVHSEITDGKFPLRVFDQEWFAFFVEVARETLNLPGKGRSMAIKVVFIDILLFDIQNLFPLLL